LKKVKMIIVIVTLILVAIVLLFKFTLWYITVKIKLWYHFRTGLYRLKQTLRKTGLSSELSKYIISVYNEQWRNLRSSLSIKTLIKTLNELSRGGTSSPAQIPESKSSASIYNK